MGALVRIFHKNQHCLTHCSQYDMQRNDPAATQIILRKKEQDGSEKLLCLATFAHSNGFGKLSYPSLSRGHLARRLLLF